MSWRERSSEFWARLADVVRRFVPTDTGDATRWGVEGFADGEETERDRLEVFQGIGFAARPPAASDAECVAVAVNARDHHVVVATRDARTLQAVIAEVGLGPDETLVCTSKAVVKITTAGEVLIGRIGGEFKAVALADHTHPLPAASNSAGSVVYSSTPASPQASTFGPSSVSTDTKVT